MSLLTVQDVSLGYPGMMLMAGLNAELSAGQLVTLLGENGAGKSTILRALSGTLRPLSGKIAVNGSDLSAISAKELARLVGVVTTDRVMAGAMTVREVVEMGRYPYTGFFGRLSKFDKVVVDRSLDSVGLIALAERYVATLSDGERQKVMIARALAQETPVVLLDEPTAFLDVASRLEILSLLQRLARSERKAILLSSHDVASAITLSDKLWLVLRSDVGGLRKLVAGVPSELIADGTIAGLFPDRDVEFSECRFDFVPKGLSGC